MGLFDEHPAIIKTAASPPVAIVISGQRNVLTSGPPGVDDLSDVFTIFFKFE
jgi:hypothetical protein